VYLGKQNQALGLHTLAATMIMKLEGLKNLRELGEAREQ
jgi:hypothetical protein